VGIFFFFIFFFSLFFQDRRLKCVCVCVCLDASLTASVQPASFPIMRRRRQLRRMRYGGTGETLVSGRLRVDAQRHLAAHQLVHYEFVQFFADLMSGGQLALPVILERVHGRRFQIGSVPTNSHRSWRIGCLTAATHARVEAQPPFVQVRMGQRVNNVYSLLL